MLHFTIVTKDKEPEASVRKVSERAATRHDGHVRKQIAFFPKLQTELDWLTWHGVRGGGLHFFPSSGPERASFGRDGWENEEIVRGGEKRNQDEAEKWKKRNYSGKKQPLLEKTGGESSDGRPLLT